MSEGQVSIDDTTHELPRPFMVMATQNPAEHYGTYPLPESQMDRFTMRVSLGYPGKTVERDLLKERVGTDPVAKIDKPVIDLATVRDLQAMVETIKCEDALLERRDFRFFDFRPPLVIDRLAPKLSLGVGRALEALSRSRVSTGMAAGYLVRVSRGTLQ